MIRTLCGFEEEEKYNLSFVITREGVEIEIDPSRTASPSPQAPDIFYQDISVAMI